MTDNLFTLMIGSSIITGSSPRYRLYPTGDGRMLAVGALEQKFWHRRSPARLSASTGILRDDSARSAGATVDALSPRSVAREIAETPGPMRHRGP